LKLVGIKIIMGGVSDLSGKIGKRGKS